MTYKEFVEAFTGISEDNFELLLKFYDGELPVHLVMIWNIKQNAGYSFGMLLAEKYKIYCLKKNMYCPYANEATLTAVTFPLCNFPSLCENIKNEDSKLYNLFLKWYLELRSIMLKICYNYEQ